MIGMREMVVSAVTTLVFVQGVHGALQSFHDRESWEAELAGGFATIDFTGFDDNTPITDQYADLGARFTTFDVISGPSIIYENDLWGLQGFDEIFVAFEVDMQWLAIDFPGVAQIEVWRDGQPVDLSHVFGGGGSGHFGGIISDEPFDAVRIWDPADNVVSLDDFHFGPPIPGPGVLGVFGIALRRHRRRW